MSSVVETMADGTVIEVDKAQAIMQKIYDLEKTNLRTKQYTSSAMVDKIKGLIEEEVECF